MMLSNDMKDVWQNIHMELTVNPDLYVDLLQFLKDANSNKKITYDLPKFITLMVLTYNNHKKPKFELQKDFHTSFEELYSLYQHKNAFEIDQWRKIKGISLAEFEKRVGLTKKAVYDIRVGDSRPSYDTILKICKALDITFYELKLPPRRSSK